MVLMGCGFSNNVNGSAIVDPKGSDFHSSADSLNVHRARAKETMIQAFTRIDDEILKFETLSPGSRLTTAEAWFEHLQNITLRVDDTSTMNIHDRAAMLMEPIEIDEQILNDPKTPTTSNENDEVEREQSDIIKLAVKLQVAFDVKKSTEHEEFLAKVSRSAMEIELQRLKNDMIEHARQRLESLNDSFIRLRDLYLEQDSLIASVSGGTYNSTIEQDLDSELEALREIRDRLSGVAEQWRTASNLMGAASKGSVQAFEFWSLIASSKIPSDRIQLAIDTRTACHSSLVAFECAQQALPQVEIPFVTNRQISAVRHAIVYILTDIANENRYEHTKKVLEAYQQSTAKAVDWIHSTYKKTLDEELTSQIDNIKVLAFRLRRERVRHFKETVGNKLYTKRFIKNVTT